MTIQKRKKHLMKIAVPLVVSAGVLTTVASVVIISSFLAILGIAFIFWGIILMYITPIKNVPYPLMVAAIMSANENIDRTLTEANLWEKGRYLSPDLLKEFESSLVFIPKYAQEPVPQLDIRKGSISSQFMLIIPPGLGLSKLFEKNLGKSFLGMDLNKLQQILPKLIVESMGLAENFEMRIQEDTITIELTGCSLQDLCEETRKLPRVHGQVGCFLSSAFACVLAKTSGKVVTIQKDERKAVDKTIFEFYLEKK